MRHIKDWPMACMAAVVKLMQLSYFVSQIEIEYNPLVIMFFKILKNVFYFMYLKVVFIIYLVCLHLIALIFFLGHN